MSQEAYDVEQYVFFGVCMSGRGDSASGFESRCFYGALFSMSFVISYALTFMLV